MEITAGVHRVDGVNGNCYVVVGEELLLVDTGLPRNGKRILDYVRNTLKRSPTDIKTIVLTHHHIDHTGSLHDLKAATNAKIAAHSADADYIAGRKTPPTPKKMSLKFKILRYFMKYKPVQPDITLEDNDMVGDFTVVHAPGHTPGSICLHSRDGRIMFVGDLLRFVGGGIQGPQPQYTADMDAAKKSLEKMSNLSFDVMLGGHGEPLMPNASEKIKAFLLTRK